MKLNPFLILFATAALLRADPPLTILSVTPDRDPVPRYERLELSLALGPAYSNPDDPDSIEVTCAFTSPSGRIWNIPGFHSGDGFKVRFAADETGTWKYSVMAKDPTGTAVFPPGQFAVSPSVRHGWVRIAENKHYFRLDDGAAWHGIGFGYPWNVDEQVLDSLKAAGANSIVYWNSTFDWKGNGGGRYLIESADSGLGRYDERKAARVDQILSWCEARDMKVIFCIWPHPFLGDEINPGNKPGGWEAFYDVNPYKNIVKAQDFFDDPKAWEYQRKLYRYMVARWSYSPALEHWWTVVETPGTDGWAFKGPEVVEAWARKVQDWFHAHDPFGHPVSGSQQGNESNYWTNGYRIFDLANREIYYNGSSYKSVVQETGKLWAGFEKPIVIGEIGNYKSPTTFHQALWSALASGAASAPYWWNYPDQWSPENWDHLRAYADFAADIPFSALSAPVRSTPTVTGGAAYAIVSKEAAFGWLLAEGGSAAGKSFVLQGLPDGPYRLSWYDTWKGGTIEAAQVSATGGSMVLHAPADAGADIAFKLLSGKVTGLASPGGRIRSAASGTDPDPAGPGKTRVLRMGANLGVYPTTAFPFRAVLISPTGKSAAAAASPGGPLMLPVPAGRTGLHYLRIEWKGGNRCIPLVL